MMKFKSLLNRSMQLAAKLSLLAIFTLSLFSCRYKGFEYRTPVGRLKVVFDWKNAPKADPSSMNIYFFPIEEESKSSEEISSRRPVHYELPGRDGGFVRLAVGKYKVFCFNNDSEVFHYRNTDSFDDFELYAGLTYTLSPMGLQVNVASALDKEQPARILPDRLWYDKLPMIEVEVSRDENDLQIITLYPYDKLCRYTVEVRNVKNLSSVYNLSGTLSSMSSSFYPGLDEISTTPTVLPFSCNSDRVSTIKGKFLTLGNIPVNNVKHILTIYMKLADGRNFYQNVDVTSQVVNAPDRKNVYILVDGLELPKPIEGEGAFKPSVEDWGEVIEHIKM